MKVKVKTKLTFNDKRDYELLPQEIESLELQIESLNECIMNPKCYEEKGLVVVSEELDAANKTYEEKVERFLELEELVENLK